MLVIHASVDHNIDTFISLVQESSCDFIIQSFLDWHNNHQLPLPQGFIYIRTSPEICLKRTNLTLDEINNAHTNNENYFINKTTIANNLVNIPILLLNGTIHFENDFSQFYTHLFSIKKFFKDIKDTEDKIKGTYIKPEKKHRGCKC